MPKRRGCHSTLPECEQELVGGYHTEYSGVRLLLFLLTEFLHLITAALLIVILFLGGWHLPFGLTGYTDDVGWLGAVAAVVVLLAKVLLVILVFMLVRWSWPRFRYDQLMALAWKIMLPLGMVNFVAVAGLGPGRAMAWGWRERSGRCCWPPPRGACASRRVVLLAVDRRPA